MRDGQIFLLSRYVNQLWAWIDLFSSVGRDYDCVEKRSYSSRDGRSIVVGLIKSLGSNKSRFKYYDYVFIIRKNFIYILIRNDWKVDVQTSDLLSSVHFSIIILKKGFVLYCWIFLNLKSYWRACILKSLLDGGSQ